MPFTAIRKECTQVTTAVLLDIKYRVLSTRVVCFSFLGGGVQVCLSATKLVFETSWIDKFVRRDRPDVAPAKFGTRLPGTSATISTIIYLF